MHASPLIFLVGSFTLIAIVMSSQAWAYEPVKSVVVLSDEAPKLNVDFASGNEHDRVSVSLATSELLVRLGKDLQLHCEVSSRDELTAAPEVGIDLKLRFKFQ